jgi:hypothetical protein
LQPFSALLVRLSREAEATAVSINQKTHSLIVLTRWLIAMTIILIGLTIPLAVSEVHRLIADFTHTNLPAPQTSESALERD